MKLINYNYGYIDKFSCSIRGKIIVDKETWRELIKYLKRITRIGYLRDLLKVDLNRTVKTKQGNLVNIRVFLTEKIVDKFHLKNYKRANYMFLILN